MIKEVEGSSLKNLRVQILLIICLCFLGLSSIVGATESLYDIAYQTYIYAYPMVLTKATQLTQNIPDNQFLHYRDVPSPSNRDVVRPNRDTMYSLAWLNLNEGPILLTVPQTRGHYYLVQLMDMWTDTFASPGSRTTGSEGGQFLIVGPNWNGQLPDATDPKIKEFINDFRLIKSPTNQVWIVCRDEIGNEEDYSDLHAIQDGYRLEQIGNPTDLPAQAELAPREDPRFLALTQMIENSKMIPPQIIAQMDAGTFFETFAELMIDNPPHIQDWPIVALMSQIGIQPGKQFDFHSVEQNVQDTIRQAAQDAQKNIQVQIPFPVVDNWRFMTQHSGSYGTSYLFRAAIAYIELGANLPEDAVYPVTHIDCNSDVLDGSKNYVVHFEPGQIPPTYSFWSLTVYDSSGYLVENPMKRYNLNSKQNELKLNPDGSLDIYLQSTSPGPEWEPNWLPVPASGRFDLTLRIYWPKRGVLDGTWKLPKVCPR